MKRSATSQSGRPKKHVRVATPSSGSSPSSSSSSSLEDKPEDVSSSTGIPNRVNPLGNRQDATVDQDGENPFGGYSSSEYFSDDSSSDDGNDQSSSYHGSNHNKSDHGTGTNSDRSQYDDSSEHESRGNEGESHEGENESPGDDGESLESENEPKETDRGEGEGEGEGEGDLPGTESKDADRLDAVLVSGTRTLRVKRRRRVKNLLQSMKLDTTMEYYRASVERSVTRVRRIDSRVWVVEILTQSSMSGRHCKRWTIVRKQGGSTTNIEYSCSNCQDYEHDRSCAHTEFVRLFREDDPLESGHGSLLVYDKPAQLLTPRRRLSRCKTL